MRQAVLNRKWSREIDRRAVEQYGMTGLVLMENAGRGIADALGNLGIDGPVVIACGSGNNAGDGFVIARHLELRGVDVRVVLLSDPAKLRGDAAANYEILVRSRMKMELLLDSNIERGDVARLDELLAGAAWIVDALLGTGAVGAVRPPLDRVIQKLNEQPARIVAVDVPSGLDCDTGEAVGAAIEAWATFTFVTLKPAYLQSSAQRFTGAVHVLEIGTPRRLVEEVLRDAALDTTAFA